MATVRHDDPLRAAVQVPPQRLGRQELAGAFQHQVAAEVTPRHGGRLGMVAEADTPVADHDSLVLDVDATTPPPMHAVELQQVRRRGNATLQLVDVRDLDPVVPPRVVMTLDLAQAGSQRQASDTAEPVNPDAHSGQARTGSPIGAARWTGWES